MKTKIVYALTCNETGTYIEQALMSVYSARYHNPDADIIVLTDDVTDKMLIGARAQINEYVTEKIVVPFDEDKSALYRSRWLKTSCRRLVRGPLVYIDCDTIIQHSLAELDDVEGDMVMVYDEHLTVEDYTQVMLDVTVTNCAKLGFDASKEVYYYNGGVILVKDTKVGNELFNKWHEEWKRGVEEAQFFGDEPSLMKMNHEMGYVITRLPDEWNCQVFMNPLFMPDAYILHYWLLKNKSYMYEKPFLNYVKEHGIDDYVKECILHSLDSMLPYTNRLGVASLKEYMRFPKRYAKGLEQYAAHVDARLEEFIWNRKLSGFEQKCLRKHSYKICMWSFTIRNFIKYKILHIALDTNRLSITK